MSGLTDADVRVLSDLKFAALVDTSGHDGCWIWRGWVCRDGYGGLTRQARKWKAHRWAYFLSRGSIEPSLTIDHLCRNRACVRPAHLELVSDHENRCRSSRSPEKAECPRGHPYDDSNTYRIGAKRFCRTCRNAASRRYKERRRASA